MEVDGNAAPWLHLQDTPTAAWIEISVIFKKNQFHLRMQYAEKCLIFIQCSIPISLKKDSVLTILKMYSTHPLRPWHLAFSVQLYYLYSIFLFLYLYSMTLWEVWTLEFRCRSRIGTTRHCGKVWKQAGPIRILICNHCLFVFCNLCLFYIVGFDWDSVSFCSCFFLN